MRRLYITAGYNSNFIGPGRPEFTPKMGMPGFEHYLRQAVDGSLHQVPNPEFDEGYVSNFMAARFIRQGNLAGFLPHFVPSLLHKPCYRLEGACGSGGLALTSAAKSIMSGLSDSAFVCGFEIQNTVKAIYGADILAGAAYHSQERKDGHAFFFPNLFSQRAGAYSQKYGQEYTRKGLAKWYENAIHNARNNSKAQEYFNKLSDPFKTAVTKPKEHHFLEHLNLYDCSKVSDGASSLVMCSEEGLVKLGLKKDDCVELISFCGSEADITQVPQNLAALNNTKICAEMALKRANVKVADLATLELHDCFSITGLLALEALEVCKKGQAAEYVFEGNTQVNGEMPTNPSGGLCGFGHPTGATGIRQMVDLVEQLTGKAENQLKLSKDFGMMVSMGGNDVTVSSIIVKKIA